MFPNWKVFSAHWTEEALRDALQEEYGLEAVLFSGLSKLPYELSQEILAQCIDINVDDNFFRDFKVHNKDLHVLRKTN